MQSGLALQRLHNRLSGLPCRLGCRWQIVCCPACLRRHVQSSCGFFRRDRFGEGDVVSRLWRALGVREKLKGDAAPQASACSRLACVPSCRRRRRVGPVSRLLSSSVCVRHACGVRRSDPSASLLAAASLRPQLASRRGSFQMAVFRICVVLSAAASAQAQALPPINVQYEHGAAATAGLESAGGFRLRVARLEERIDHAGAQLLQPAGSDSSSFVSQAVGGPTAFADLSAHFDGMSSASVKAALRDATVDALRAEGLPLSEAQCVRDYNAPCPTGWTDLGDGGSCAAPVTYDGPCGGALSFKGLAAHEKMQLADSCGVSFACAGACAADYAQPCPDGWAVDAAGACAAPAAYVGPCVGGKHFGQYAGADKAAFEVACGVRWACRRPWSESRPPSASQGCVADFAAPCPRDWSSRNGVCAAPASYSGPCPVFWSFRGYDAEEKQVVVDQCGVSWPCQ